MKGINDHYKNYMCPVCGREFHSFDGKENHVMRHGKNQTKNLNIGYKLQVE